MIPRLYENTETSFANFGIGPLSDAISCYVTEERNGEFFLEMEYPRDGRLADEITYDRIILADPYDNSSMPEPFRISKVSYSLTGNIVVYAEHISYQLNSIIVGAFSATVSTPAAAYTAAASHVYNTNPFSFSSDITGGISRTFGPEMAIPLRTLFGGIRGSFIDSFGGELKWNRYTVNLLSARGADNGVKIAYTKNLTGLDYEVDISGVYTSAIAYWLNGTYQCSTLQSGTNDYSYARTVVFDATGEFQTQPTQAALNSYASSKLTANAAKPGLSIDVSFVPLWQTEEYKDLYALEHVALCDTVTVQYPPLNLSVKAKVVKTVYDVLADRYSELTISTVRQSLADTINDIMKEQSQNDAGMKIFKTVSKSASYNIGGNANKTITADDLGLTTPAGFTPVAVTRVHTGDASVGVRVWNATATGTSGVVVLRNYSSSTISDLTVSVEVLYMNTSYQD